MDLAFVAEAISVCVNRVIVIHRIKMVLSRATSLKRQPKKNIPKTLTALLSHVKFYLQHFFDLINKIHTTFAVFDSKCFSKYL